MSEISIKSADVIQQFCGESDFGEWIRKVELVAKLQKVTELEIFVPLFLSGGAFAVYENLDELVKKDYKKLRGALLKAFSSDQLRAYEEFATRCLRPEETVYVYVADLRRLAMLVDGSASEEWIKCKLISGLPGNLKTQLVAVCSLEQMTLADVTDRVRALANACGTSIGAVSLRRPGGEPPSYRGDSGGDGVKCFKCGGIGHISRNCSSPSGGSRGGGITCYNCGVNGHVARECPHRSRDRGGGGGGSSDFAKMDGSKNASGGSH